VGSEIFFSVPSCEKSLVNDISLVVRGKFSTYNDRDAASIISGIRTLALQISSKESGLRDEVKWIFEICGAHAQATSAHRNISGTLAKVISLRSTKNKMKGMMDKISFVRSVSHLYLTLLFFLIATPFRDGFDHGP